MMSARSAIRSLRQYLISGILVLVPIVISAQVLKILLGLCARMSRPLSRVILAAGLPYEVAAAASVLLLVLLVLLAGVMVHNVVGRRLLAWFEIMLGRIPVASLVYKWARQAVAMLTTKSGVSPFKSVVLVDFPRQGMRAIGFVTGSIADETGRECYKVFIPTAPTPTTGFVQVVPREDVVITDMSVEDGIKMVVSVGLLSVDKIGRRASKSGSGSA